jgi:hypothetical protein
MNEYVEVYIYEPSHGHNVHKKYIIFLGSFNI